MLLGESYLKKNMIVTVLVRVGVMIMEVGVRLASQGTR